MGEKGARARLAVACLVTAAVCASFSTSGRAEKIGKVTQPLVAGTEVSADEQQQQALVSLSSRAGSCSGVLLNSEWVISAAHCFQDPNVRANEVTVRARWPKRQTRTGMRLDILANDIAILRVDKPFDEVSPDFNMPVFTGTLTPGRSLLIYGRGIHILASGKGNSAQPSQSDGKYRKGEFEVSKADGRLITFGPGKKGVTPAGGDSGGPAFINAGGQTHLAGISSSCQTRNVQGKADDPNDPWMWVGTIESCSYATVASVWSDIQARIGSPGCRKYAWRAVGTVEYAKYVGCDPAVISGPRWSPNFDEHLNWCMNVPAASANAEDKARNQIAQECRIAAAMPQGTGQLKVAETPDGFALSGGGYPVNSRIIIRVKGPAAVEQNITSNFSDPKGNFAATVSAAQVCAKAGPITFTAEDQDRPPSPPVTMTCKASQVATAPAPKLPAPPPVVDAGPAPQPQPQAQPLQKFVRVALDVDLYNGPGGGGLVIGMLRRGTIGVRLVEPCSDGWCHVAWPQGQGWVYSGPGYQSLNMP